MIHITDEVVASNTSATEVQRALHASFQSLGRGAAALQERVRTQANGVKLSTLGAVLPEQGFVGAKIYTTINGQFQFVILLFSADDGRPLATLDAAAITRLRTAATTVLAAKALASQGPQTLAVFGAGQQGSEHIRQLCAAFDIERVLLVDPYASSTKALELTQECGRPVELTDAERAVKNSQMIVAASRSTTPLFSGTLIRPGAFVAAIGSSLPHTRELDDEALRRASRVVVDWRQQAMQEAGDLVLADPECLPESKVVELSAVLTQPPLTHSPTDITIYKSVGIGLQDIAIAGLVYARITAQRT
ncbi:ornithine cyclodeaminase family protein [Xanthomonas axonopodis]|uniref:ornithine cyclodeaminase family protein n=1 Tax=Xanthomonas axonopodis TaxID=53413 RepID=UPI003556C366